MSRHSEHDPFGDDGDDPAPADVSMTIPAEPLLARIVGLVAAQQAAALRGDEAGQASMLLELTSATDGEASTLAWAAFYMLDEVAGALEAMTDAGEELLSGYARECVYLAELDNNEEDDL